MKERYKQKKNIEKVKKNVRVGQQKLKEGQ